MLCPRLNFLKSVFQMTSLNREKLMKGCLRADSEFGGARQNRHVYGEVRQGWYGKVDLRVDSDRGGAKQKRHVYVEVKAGTVRCMAGGTCHLSARSQPNLLETLQCSQATLIARHHKLA